MIHANQVFFTGNRFFAVASFPADYRRKMAQIFAGRDQNLRLSACFSAGNLRENKITF